MLLGHIGIGFAGKSVSKTVPLWLFIAAALFPDLVILGGVLFGVNDPSNFWSHSLLMTLMYTAVLSTLIHLVYKNLRDTLIFGGLILSHWLCDFISWPLEVVGINKEIFLFTREASYGLGLYKTLTGAVISELFLLGIGVMLFIISFKKKKTAPYSRNEYSL